MNEILTSPILYMGNKTRLIKKGLTKLFPNDIDMLVDVFAGSGAIAMNVPAKSYILNDTDDTLHAYYAMFSKHSEQEIIRHIKLRIDEYKLPKKTTIRCFSDEREVAYYKRSYHNFRDLYNKTREPFDLYVLMFFAFSQQFRVNKKGEFNMPFGNNCFSKKNEKNIATGCHFFSKSNVFLEKKDFSLLLSDLSLKKDDFVYFDPPYSITTATYNENEQWSINDDFRLFDLCHHLNKHGIKFGLSNVLFNKGVENKLLREFCLDSKLNVFSPSKFLYHACGRENIKQQEVFICNYDKEVCQDKHMDFVKITL